MKETNLGEFQEIVMLVILTLEKDAYGVTIQQTLSDKLGRQISRGALHTALTRLEEKGMIRSTLGEPTMERGGRRKRYYEVSNTGMEVLKEAKDLRQSFWSMIPAFDQ